ncbi:Homoserine kinase [Wickerhamiella sorbophila]|uniref:Homoserine kinase n=1 Tax=Wickerhamiella sorbophila TaxID=45607 RepID=A0A2T0FIM5_9ASCO|nr:Homoserine kinase [Wickerhamiella sorbophila]PRT54835.1 Homoserine kinase [Wickerhamiella sorbophila]
MRQFTIRVPASSANIGPGFDVLGIALSLYLTIEVTIDHKNANNVPLNCEVTNSGLGAEQLPTAADANLITRTALYILRCHGMRTFPVGTKVHINNDIPLGRGLGSSGAAVIAGVMLGNAVGQLDLSKERLMDFALMIERHPDNISAAMFGGFVGSFLRELSGTELERVEIPVAEVLPEPSGGVDTGLTPPEPPVGISRQMSYDLAPELKAIAVIPAFEVSTAKSRDVLPTAYTRQDAIFNLQRLSVLIPALGRSPVDAELVHLAMQDRLHQKYRRILVPGLATILTFMTPRTHKGFVGVCLSGAGPTVLALATENFDAIAEEIVSAFNAEGVECTWKLLDCCDGATVEEK